MIHPEPHPLTGQAVRLRAGLEHPDFARGQFGRLPVVAKDWYDRAAKHSWQEGDGDPVCLMYYGHREREDLPWDDEVVLVRFRAHWLLVHASELDFDTAEGGETGRHRHGATLAAADHGVGSSPTLPFLFTLTQKGAS